MQLGAFYPFARNHNHEASIPQEPYSFGDVHAETSRISLKTRYSLLKQMYTWMVRKGGTGSFFKPIFFEFHEEVIAYNSLVVESQFLIGKSLMVTPVVEENSDDRMVYFPGAGVKWY